MWFCLTDTDDQHYSNFQSKLSHVSLFSLTGLNSARYLDSAPSGPSLKTERRVMRISYARYISRTTDHFY